MHATNITHIYIHHIYTSSSDYGKKKNTAWAQHSYHNYAGIYVYAYNENTPCTLRYHPPPEVYTLTSWNGWWVAGGSSLQTMHPKERSPQLLATVVWVPEGNIYVQHTVLEVTWLTRPHKIQWDGKGTITHPYIITPQIHTSATFCNKVIPAKWKTISAGTSMLPHIHQWPAM